MIRVLLLVLLALAAGAAAAYYLRLQNGYVLISYGPWILESSVLGFVAGGAVIVLALMYGLRLLAAALRLPSTVRGALAQRRERRAQQSFEEGLQKLLEGQWQQAEVELVRRASDHHASALSYLLAARAAQWSGARERCEQYLDLAAQQGEATAFAAALVRAELQIERHEYAEALKVLQALHAREPRQPYVIERLADVHARAGQWEPLRQLLAGVERNGAMPAPRLHEWQARALRELMARASETANLASLKSLWDAAAAPVRARADVRRPYVRGLARVGAEAEAAAHIVQTLKTEWDAELALAYGTLEGIDAMTQLATVESWLAQHGEKAEVLLTAGRVCVRNRLWGKARSYLDGAIRQQPSAEAYLALARLCEETKNPAEAQLFHKQGLELATRRA